MGEESKKTNSLEPAKIGRPSLYHQEYCQLLIDHMAEGLSYESFAGVVGTHRDTLYNWEKAFPEFLDAKKQGSARNLLYWEKVGQDGLWDVTEYNEDGKPRYKKSLNSTVWIFSMKNRHKWRDKQPDEETQTVLQPFIIEAPIAGKRIEIKTEEDNGPRKEAVGA